MNASEISSGIRSVIHVAVYFEELKQSARDLTERAAASARGYFTPDEEEAAQGLLVSYWQTRNALFELITSFRADTESIDEERPPVFLTAFAAALLLVDAARFLRETVHDRPLVRQKLNEPLPQFGIEGGVYDHVQRSLLSARNAWHLYHAIEYFEENESELRERAANSQLEPVMQIVDRLRHRLDVSVAQFARVKLRTRASQTVRKLARSLLGRAMYGLQKWGGNLVADKYVRLGHRPALPTDISARLRSLLLPGDVIIVRKEYALTNYFLPGYWPHAALYLGRAESLQPLEPGVKGEHRPRWRRLLEAAGDSEDRVLESMKDGVFVRSLDSPFASDSIVILRPNLQVADVGCALGRSLLHEDKAYDFDFDFRRADRLVCTEVVYRAYDGVGDLSLPLTVRAGRPTLSGSDLIHMAIDNACFHPVAVFAPELAKDIVIGTAAVKVLQAGEGDHR